MRLVLTLAPGLILLCSAAQAREYPWCVTSSDGLFDCSYVTYEQCQVTASGIGGCVQNPRALAGDAEPDRFYPDHRPREHVIR